MTSPAPPDWGVGRYERTAAQLLPAARAAVEAAAPAAGERVVDVGCGTGNAALLAAERGARVIGVDPAERLLEVARADAAARGLDATFVAGDAGALPVPDDGADLVLSVFGVIFAPDAEAAAAELDRVTAPEGRVVLTAWVPGGAVGTMVRLAREAHQRVLGAPPAPPPFPWQERDALTGLLGPHGFAVDVQERPISFTGSSPEAYFDAEQASYPPAVGSRPALESAGETEALRERSLALLREANEDPDAFRVTSRYVIVSARRGAR